MTEEIRQIIADHGRLSLDVSEVAPDTDLYQAGMTSHASVNVMLALEDHFDIEFPTRCSSAACSRASRRSRRRSKELRADSRHERPVDRDQAFLDAVVRIAEEMAAPHADDGRSRGALPGRDDRRACERARALSAFVPEELGGGGVSFAAIAEACFELGRRCAASAMVFAMHQIQVGDDRAPPRRRRRGSRTICASCRREQRLIASVTSEIGTGGDMGRSIAAVTPEGDGHLQLREAGADRQLRRARRRSADHGAPRSRAPSRATR